MLKFFKEGKMKNGLRGFAAMSSLFFAIFFLAALPVRGEGVDEKIKAMEQELSRLKAEQMELKKEAVAAEAKLPNFFYRPGGGATIEAGDRGWSLNFSYELNYFIYNSTSGNPHRGNTVMDLNLRRNRPQIVFCLNNCFYEWGIKFRLDTEFQVREQNQWFDVHFEQINPMFPTLTIGDRTSPVTFPYVARSSSSSAQVELASDMLSDEDVDELSRKSIGISWRDRPLPILPGDFTLDLEFKSGAGIFENVLADTDRKQIQGTFGVKPFNRSMNPWLEKIKVGGGVQLDSIDARSAFQGKRLRIRTMERGRNRVTLLDAPGIGAGFHRRLEGGVEWGFGPYLARLEGGWSKFASGGVAATVANPNASDGFLGVSGRYWRIGNEIFLWSPKGLLTGSAATPHSLQLGWAFERSSAECGKHLGAAGVGRGCASLPTVAGFNDFHRNVLINRDLALWYFISRAIRVGAWWWWWDAANTPRAVQTQIGCTKNSSVALGKAGGKSCSWHTVNLGLMASF
jgi:hypothetical protein